MSILAILTGRKIARTSGERMGRSLGLELGSGVVCVNEGFLSERDRKAAVWGGEQRDDGAEGRIGLD